MFWRIGFRQIGTEPVFTGVLETVTDRLQRVLIAVSHVVSDTRKFDRGLSRIMHTKLHWLDVPERINYKLGMLTYRCQHNKAPRYLMDHCTSVSNVAYRQRLRSASSHEVSVPRHWLSTYRRRAFAVASPIVWISLPEDLWDPEVSEDSYRQPPETFYMCSTSVFSALEIFLRECAI